jgi:hypothetical protein
VRLVRFSNVMLILCLALASVLFTGIVLFIVDFLAAPPLGAIAAACVFVVVLVLWIAVPLIMRAKPQPRGDAVVEDER